MKLLAFALLLVSTTAMAKTVHIYKCIGADDIFVSVDASVMNDTAYIADDKCRDIDSSLSAHVMQSVVTTVDDFQKLDINNPAMEGIYLQITVENQRYRIQNYRSQRTETYRRHDVRNFCSGLQRLDNQNGYRRHNCIM